MNIPYLDGEGSTLMRDRLGAWAASRSLPGSIARDAGHRASLLGAEPGGPGKAIGPEQNVLVHG